MPISPVKTMVTPQPVSSPPRALRILYADDLPGLRNLMRHTLSRDGHTVECVPDGHSAMEKLSAALTAFDLVITDHHMPDWSGLDLVTWLRHVPFSGRILVFTSDTSPDLNEAYQSLHVDRILHKPAPLAILRQVVAELAL
jgi:two-component system chemotaxis response regulator CheY